MAVSSSALPFFLQGICFIIALISVRMQMYRTIDRSDHGRRLYAMHKKTGDKTRVNSEGAALFSPSRSVSPSFSCSGSLNHSIFIAEPINGKPVSIVCSVLRPLPSSSTPHYRNVSSHQCLYLSLPGWHWTSYAPAAETHLWTHTITLHPH